MKEYPLVDSFEVGETCLFYHHSIKGSRRGIIVESYKRHSPGSTSIKPEYRFKVNYPEFKENITSHDKVWFKHLKEVNYAPKEGCYGLIWEDMFNSGSIPDSNASLHTVIERVELKGGNLWMDGLSSLRYRVTKIGSIYDWDIEKILTYPHRQVVEMGIALTKGIVYDDRYKVKAQEYCNEM